jgi:hypothetical protein
VEIVNNVGPSRRYAQAILKEKRSECPACSPAIYHPLALDGMRSHCPSWSQSRKEEKLRHNQRDEMARTKPYPLALDGRL